MIWGFAGISGSFLVAAFSVNQLHAAVPVYRLAFSQRAPRNARPHEVGGGRTVRLRWFHAGIHVLHGLACLPPAITPAVGRPARCTVTLPGDTGSVEDVAPHRQQASSRIWRVATSPTRVLQAQITQRCTRYVAIHPIRRTAPDQKGCNAYGSGAPPPTTSTTADNCFPFTHSRSVSQGPCKRHYTRSVALHPIRRGVMPTDRVHRYPQQVSVWRYASTPWRNTRQRSSAATEETVHHRETRASDKAADSSTHQLLGHSTTRTTCACQRLRSLCGDNHAISSLLRHTSSHGR